jgi:hypothetical protein
MTGLCTKVQVGKDQRVVNGQIHNLVIVAGCYGVITVASKLVQW